MNIPATAWPRWRTGGLTLIVAAALAACGGGGGNDNTGSGSGAAGTGGAGTGGSEAVVLHMPDSTPVQPPQATGNVAADAFHWMNYRRAQSGLPAMQWQAQLEKAAAAHASYIALNDSYAAEGHDETPGKPGFTGATPMARIQAAGYTSNGVGENINGANAGMGGAYFTDNLIDAPYHRGSQLSTFTQAGAGASDFSSEGFAQTAYVIDFGAADAQAAQAKRLWAHPRPGQADAYTDWIARENPNPVPDLEGQRVGYPITLHAANGQALNVGSFTLADSRGVAVTTRQITTLRGNPLRDFAIWIPLAPLLQGMAYTATATGSLNGQDFRVQWSFSTLRDTALQVTASPGGFSGPGSAVTFSVEGGTGQYEGYTYSGRFFQNMANYPWLAGVVQKSGNQWVITRDSVACPPGTAPCGEVVATFTDTAGQKVSITLPLQ